MPFFHPSLPLGVRQPFLGPEAALGYRIRMVLETRPGQLPWRPRFGCDLSSLVGQPATPQRLNEARWRVEEALRKWIPDAKLNRCDVRIVQDPGVSSRDRSVPLAEASLLSFGAQASLEVSVDMETPEGEFSLQTVIEP